MKWFLTILLASFAFTLQAQDYKLEGSEVKITKPVLFEAGSAKLKPESTAALQILLPVRHSAKKEHWLFVKN